MCPLPGAQELDTTLQVLGIDGLAQPPSVRVTASPHAPSVAAPAGAAGGMLRSGSLASSLAWSPRAEGRATSEAGQRCALGLCMSTVTHGGTQRQRYVEKFLCAAMHAAHRASSWHCLCCLASAVPHS